MKCPVCDQENSTMLCPQCGFDASRDYERYPSFGAVSSRPSVSAMRRDWYMQDQEKLDQISALISTLSVLRYQRIMALTATLRQVHYRNIAMDFEAKKPLRMANLRIRQLEDDLRREKEQHKQSQLDLKSARDDAAFYKNLSQEQTENHRQLQRLIEILQQEKNDYWNALLQSAQSNQELQKKMDASNDALNSTLYHIKTLEDALSSELKKGVGGKMLDNLDYFMTGLRRQLPKRPWKK